MNFQEFSKMNRARCESPTGFNHALQSWSLSDWVTAVTGELGEAANVVKKLNRYRDNIPGNTESEAELRQNLKDELADTFTYLDLLAQAADINILEAAYDKFHRVSKKIGWDGQPKIEQESEACATGGPGLYTRIFHLSAGIDKLKEERKQLITRLHKQDTEILDEALGKKD